MLLSWDPPGDSLAWHEKAYAGRTEYRLVGRGENAVLHAVANGRNSAWLTQLETRPDSLRLSWRWRVLQHPLGANCEVRARDDRAAGVLVIENAPADSLWRVVERDLAADLKTAFGEVPERAEAEFGPIQLLPLRPR